LLVVVVWRERVGVGEERGRVKGRNKESTRSLRLPHSLSFLTRLRIFVRIKFKWVLLTNVLRTLVKDSKSRSNLQVLCG